MVRQAHHEREEALPLSVRPELVEGRSCDVFKQSWYNLKNLEVLRGSRTQDSTAGTPTEVSPKGHSLWRAAMAFSRGT